MDCPVLRDRSDTRMHHCPGLRKERDGLRTVYAAVCREIPASVVIERAFLTLFCFDLAGSISIEARSVAQDWVELDVSWNDRTGVIPWNTPGGDYSQEIVGSVRPSEQFMTIDIGLSTVLVKKWLQDPNENLGIMLIPVSGAPETGYAAFMSSEESNVALRPMLTVVYSIP